MMMTVTRRTVTIMTPTVKIAVKTAPGTKKRRVLVAIIPTAKVKVKEA